MIRARPLTRCVAVPSSRSRIERDWWAATYRAWATVRSRSTWGVPCWKARPIASARTTVARTPAVESSVFDGIASHSVALPPSPTSSTSVTWAPIAVAALAAAYPAGPPPRITKRIVGVY